MSLGWYSENLRRPPRARSASDVMWSAAPCAPACLPAAVSLPPSLLFSSAPTSLCLFACASPLLRCAARAHDMCYHCPHGGRCTGARARATPLSSEYQPLKRASRGRRTRFPRPVRPQNAPRSCFSVAIAAAAEQQQRMLNRARPWGDAVAEQHKGNEDPERIAICQGAAANKQKTGRGGCSGESQRHPGEGRACSFLAAAPLAPRPRPTHITSRSALRLGRAGVLEQPGPPRTGQTAGSEDEPHA